MRRLNDRKQEEGSTARVQVRDGGGLDQDDGDGDAEKAKSERYSGDNALRIGGDLR